MDLVERGEVTEEGELLTDEQVDRLLHQAEVRLRNEAASVKRHEQLPRFPKLDISSLPTPYIRASDTVARADPRMLLDDGQRQLANTYRKIEDPLVVRQKRLAVSMFLLFYYSMPMRKIFLFLLEQISGTVLVASLR